MLNVNHSFGLLPEALENIKQELAWLWKATAQKHIQ